MLKSSEEFASMSQEPIAACDCRTDTTYVPCMNAAKVRFPRLHNKIAPAARGVPRWAPPGCQKRVAIHFIMKAIVSSSLRSVPAITSHPRGDVTSSRRKHSCTHPSYSILVLSHRYGLMYTREDDTMRYEQARLMSPRHRARVECPGHQTAIGVCKS